MTTRSWHTRRMIVEDWLKDGFNTVIFCRYIATANYVGEKLLPLLQKKYPKVDLQVITSEDPDDVRKQRIDAMEGSKHRVLVCTDCLSEGINLQKYFTAVLHYDLAVESQSARTTRRSCRPIRPDGPCRQSLPAVRVRQSDRRHRARCDSAQGAGDQTCHGHQRAIPGRQQEHHRHDCPGAAGQSRPANLTRQRSTTSSGSTSTTSTRPRRQNSKPATRWIAWPNRKRRPAVFSLRTRSRPTRSKRISKRPTRPSAIRRRCENSSTRPSTICLVLRSSSSARVTSYSPTICRRRFARRSRPTNELLVSFNSPTPEDYQYIGRNHPFVEQLCQLVLANTINRRGKHAARAAVIRTDAVTIKTTILLFRVRNVIESRKQDHQIVAEEMMVWGYRGTGSDGDYLTSSEAKDLLIDGSAYIQSDAAGSIQLSGERVPAVGTPARAVRPCGRRAVTAFGRSARTLQQVDGPQTLSDRSPSPADGRDRRLHPVA